jgi:hypothetical protein
VILNDSRSQTFSADRISALWPSLSLTRKKQDTRVKESRTRSQRQEVGADLLHEEDGEELDGHAGREAHHHIRAEHKHRDPLRRNLPPAHTHTRIAVCEASWPATALSRTPPRRHAVAHTSQEPVRAWQMCAAYTVATALCAEKKETESIRSRSRINIAPQESENRHSLQSSS